MMKIEIHAPNVPVSDLCAAAELFADYLGLKAHYDGGHTIQFRAMVSSTSEPKPLLSVAVPHSPKRSEKGINALQKVLRVAPRGSYLATIDYFSAIYPPKPARNLGADK